MTIKLLQDSRVLLPAGAVVETTDEYAQRLIALGRAEAKKADPKSSKKSEK